jgi:ORF6N domain
MCWPMQGLPSFGKRVLYCRQLITICDKLLLIKILFLMQLQVIQNLIYEIRGQNVMLDFDIAELYSVETRALNQAVKRNKDRFPKDFMFQLTQKEFENLRSQFVIASQPGDKAGWGGRRTAPFAFTEHGVTMLASILKSKKAIQMNIAIVRAFIALKQFALNYRELAGQIKDLKAITGSHTQQLNKIYEALENMLDEKQNEKKWEERERIGFKK